jgi:hypothetical protein
MRPITGENGDLLYGAQVTVRESGMSVPLSQALYAGPTGSQQLSNPFVTSSGVIDFWLDTPQRVSVLVQREGSSDILVYLDAAPPPEETAVTEAPLVIVGDQVPGNVLLAGSTPGQAVWGPAPASTGITPQVTVINEAYSLGRDPSGWSFTQAASTTRDYTSDVPTGRGFVKSLHAKHTGDSGNLAVVTPGFTLTEPGFVGLWIKPSLVSGESIVISATTQSGTKTVLETLTTTRVWGFYRYPLAAGTYQSFSLEFKGAATLSGSTGHEMWTTGLAVLYGGQVPAHTHGGSGANSVLLGASAEASGINAVAVGYTAKATASNAVAVGYHAQALGTDAVAVGNGATASSVNSTAIGPRANGSLAATGWTAVGTDSYVDSNDGTAIGRASKVYGASSIAVGYTSYVGPGATNAVALGTNAQALAPDSFALGANSVVAATHNGSMAVGASAKTTGAQQIMLGNLDSLLRSVIVASRLYALGAVNFGTDATSRLGFYGAEGTIKPVVTGSDGGVLALRNLLGALAGLGLITNNTTN